MSSRSKDSRTPNRSKGTSSWKSDKSMGTVGEITGELRLDSTSKSGALWADIGTDNHAKRPNNRDKTTVIFKGANEAIFMP